MTSIFLHTATDFKETDLFPFAGFSMPITVLFDITITRYFIAHTHNHFTALFPGLPG